MVINAVVLVGDSLVEFNDWDTALPGYMAYNMGIAGERIEETVERLPRIKRKHPEAGAVVVMVGINNVANGDTGIIGHYRELLAGLRSYYPGARIYTTSLLPTLLPWVAEADIVRLNAMIEDVSTKGGARYMDMFSVFKKCGPARCLVDDGIHISREGYSLWSGALMEEFKK